MPHELTTSLLKDSQAVFHSYKTLAERAMTQVADADLLATLDGEMNSIALVIKHMAGNMRSRWTDFLTSDGEKPDRNRDQEFEKPPATRAEIMAVWERGWNHVFSALAALDDAQMSETVTIRGEAHTVMQAINRQIAHYSYHVGQIVLLAKHFAGAEWRALTIPRPGQKRQE